MIARLTLTGLIAGALVALAPAASAQPKLCGGMLPGSPHAGVTACATGHGGTTYYPPKKKKDCDHHDGPHHGEV